MGSEMCIRDRIEAPEDNAAEEINDCDCTECQAHCEACQMEAIQTTVSVTETRVKQPSTPLIMMTAARRQAIRASLEPSAPSLEFKN